MVEKLKYKWSIFDCLEKTGGMFNLFIEYNTRKFIISINNIELKLSKF